MNREEINHYKELIDEKPISFKTLPEEARNVREIVIYALDKDPFNMWYLGNRIKNDKDFAMNTLSKYPTFHLNKLGQTLQADRDVVLFAMERNQTFDLVDLERTCKYFIDDDKVIQRAMEKLEENKLIVPGEIQIGRAMIANYMGKEKALEEIAKDPSIYIVLGPELKRDQDIAIAAIDGNNELVNDIAKELQNLSFFKVVLRDNPKVLNAMHEDNPFKEVLETFGFSDRDKNQKETINTLRSIMNNARMEKESMKSEDKPRRQKYENRDRYER